MGFVSCLFMVLIYGIWLKKLFQKLFFYPYLVILTCITEKYLKGSVVLYVGVLKW